MKMSIILTIIFFLIPLINFTDEYATTESGKKVLLKDNGTWNYVKESEESKLKEIASWKGSGIKNTETFHISTKEWLIMWATTPHPKYGDMNFQIYVYNANGDIVDIVANIIGEGKDYSTMRGSGDYYLTINSAQPYYISIFEK